MTATSDKTPPAPVPAPTPPAPEAPKVARGYVHVLRNFSGYLSGEVVNATSWLHTASLVESRHVTPADKDLVAASLPCSRCRKRWLDADTLASHPCAFDED